MIQSIAKFTLLVALFFAPAAYADHEQIINTVIDDILKPLANLFFILATAFFIWGVVEYIAGASSESARTTGRSHMICGIVGLLIMTSVYFILSILSSFFYP